MFVRNFATLAACLAIVGCVRSAVMPLAADTVQITTDAAPVCGRTGAQNVAFQRAAVETIKRGFDKFIVLGGQSDSSLAGFTPVTASRIGNTVIVGGGVPMVRHGTGIVIKMFRDGDPAGANAIDARGSLGPKWQDAVREGGTVTC